MLTLSPKNSMGKNLLPVATVIFSTAGFAGDPDIDVDGVKIFLDKDASADDVNAVGAVGTMKGIMDVARESKDAKDTKRQGPETKLEKTIRRLDPPAGDYSKEFLMKDSAHVFPLPHVRVTDSGPEGTEKTYRECYYISGPCNCGKSTWVAKTVRLWKHERRSLGLNDTVYLFSRVSCDHVFKNLGVTHILINEELTESPFEVDEELQDCMVIFDDIDSITDKVLREYMWELRDELLGVGSHIGTYVINTSHELTNWKSTRSSLKEATSITMFPGAERQKIKDFLKEKQGLSKQQVEAIMALKTRWITLYRYYPPYLVHERGVMML
jgi:hypothetical protein